MANTSILAAFNRFWEHTVSFINNKIQEINIEKDWNQTDETAKDYIKNKTHGNEISTNEIMCDGSFYDVSGDTAYFNYYDNAFFKVSDSIPTTADLLGSVITSYNLDLDEGITVSEDMIFEDIGLIGIKVSENALILVVNDLDSAFSNNENISYDASITTYTNGTYFLFYDENQYIQSLSYISLSIKQLDEKFIPDTIARTDDINVVKDWNQNDETQSDYIENKPAITQGNTENSIMMFGKTKFEYDEENQRFVISVE